MAKYDKKQVMASMKKSRNNMSMSFSSLSQSKEAIIKKRPEIGELIDETLRNIQIFFRKTDITLNYIENDEDEEKIKTSVKDIVIMLETTNQNLEIITKILL